MKNVFFTLLFVLLAQASYAQNPCDQVIRLVFDDSSATLEGGTDLLYGYLESIDPNDLNHFIIEFDIKNQSPDSLNNARSSAIQKIINEQFSTDQVKYKIIPPEEPEYFTGSWAPDDHGGRWEVVQKSIVLYADCKSLYPEKMKLRQSFVDSMHYQTREHIIIDSLSNYYKKRWYLKLNQAQKDLVFIRNFSNELYRHDFADLLVNHSDLILEEAYNVFRRIDCKTTLEKIEEFREVRKYFEPQFVNGEIPAVLDENSPEYDDAEDTKLYNAILAVQEWISFLPREKVLSIYNYIIDHKSDLYE